MTTEERNTLAQSLRGPVDLKNQDSGAGIWKQFIAERVAARDPNYCRICTPKGLGYCRCDIAMRSIGRSSAKSSASVSTETQ